MSVPYPPEYNRDASPVNEHGSKARIGVGNTSEPPDARSYSDWRRTVGGGCYALDVDYIEWRFINGAMVPVAVFEMTYYKNKPHLRHLLPKYCDEVLARYKTDLQRATTLYVSTALDVPAYLIIARYDLEVFFVTNFRSEERWQMSEPEFRRWIESLRPTVRATEDAS